MMRKSKNTRSVIRPVVRRPSTWDVFLSYSSRDIAVASRIAADLRAGGLTVWHDVSNVYAGDRVREQIDRAIRSSKVFVLLASPRSLASPWVLNELDAAMLTEISTRRKYVVPILIGRIDADSLPRDVVGKHYVDLRHNFGKRYQAKRTYILESVRLLAREMGVPPSECIRLVPDFANRILSHRFEGDREPDEEVRATIPAFITSVLDDSWKLADPDAVKRIERKTKDMFGMNVFDRKRCRDTFRRRYGRFGVQQLALFLVDYLGISFSGGYKMEEVASLIQLGNFFMGMFSLREFLVKEQGLDLAVAVFERDNLAFRVIDGVGT